ncbi:MAG: glycosyltransferase family 1 protein [Saprospiraceae bacterium]
MNIYYEAKRVFYNHTGLGNYGRWLVEEYSKYFPSDNLFLLKPGNKETVYDSNFNQKPFKIISYTNQLGIPRIFQLMNKVPSQSVFHGLSAEIPFRKNRKDSKVVVTIHDVIFLSRKNDYHWIDRNIYWAKLNYSIKNADQIISISEFTSKELIKYTDVDPTKITTLYQNCKSIFYQKLEDYTIDAERKRFALPNEYWICVSSFNERKNIISILKAYKILKENDRIPLVFVGGGQLKKKMMNLSSEYNLMNKFIFLDHVPAHQLPALYQGSCGLIYPSLMEGFGIPAVEAMASGIPILGHQSSAVEEAAGKAGVFIDCNIAEDLADSILRLQNDAQLRKELERQSRLELQRFDNGKLMNELNQIYSA